MIVYTPDSLGRIRSETKGSVRVLSWAWRWLVWGMFVVAQTMTPFVHVHAAPAAKHADHAAFLHLHVATPAQQEGVESSHDRVLEIGQGIRSRHDLGTAPAMALPALPPAVREPVPHPGGYLAQPGGRSLPPERHLDRHPPALAPPEA